MMKYENNEYYSDDIRAIDAKYEAQKIAFAPFVFQAARCLKEMGVLKVLFTAGDEGIEKQEILEKTGISSYAFNVLAEMGLSMNVIKIVKDSTPARYYLGKVGFFLLDDPMTSANMDFMHDVCYQANFFMEESLNSSSPAGLKVFGDWPTVYEGLSSLPDKVKESWFRFDHYYSDNAFPSALKFVYRKQYDSLMDIGGNTAKWALASVKHNEDVKITIVDLPGQANVARNRIEEQGYSDRISVFEGDMLKEETALPAGHDAVWMSQFLDCFSLDEIKSILTKVYNAVDANCDVFVMEPLWDKQKYSAARFSLHATSLYFTSVANGNSKMYGYNELVDAIESVGFRVVEENHSIGPNDYSILKFNKVL